MVGFSSWADINFNLIQTIGILGGLLLTAAAAHREAKAREVENLLSISDHHRNLWEEAHRREDLQRVFRTDVDVEKKPATVAEEVFLNLVFNHFQTSWRIAKAGGIITTRELAIDARGFFSLPLPCAVWEKTKSFRNPRFVQFAEKAMKL